MSNKKINSWNIGWQIAPRINSAGRLEHANTAYELLMTKDKNEAINIALNLNDKNSKRQKITDEIFTACKEIVDKEIVDDKILILVSPNLTSQEDCQSWSEGVIGLVAGRLSEQYFRPVLVITESKSEIRGSGRSIEEFDITWAIEQAKEFLTKFGGHAQACGFSLRGKASLSGFIDKMKKIANDKLAGLNLKKKLIIDTELNLGEIDEKLVLDLEKLEPFGEDNARPVFLTKNLEIRDIIKMGVDSQHLKFRLNNFWAVGFSQAEKWESLRIGDSIDMVYFLEFNEFNGRREVQLKIVDIKRTGEEKYL